MSDVFMVDARATGVKEGYTEKIGLLLSAPDFAEMIPQGKKVTLIKANYSRIGYTRYIRPVLLRAVVEKVMEMGGQPAITDTSGFHPRGKIVGNYWLAATEIMGYSLESLGCDRFLANGYEGDDGEFISTGGSELGGVEVARAIREADCLVVVSHVTAHPQAGMFGAIANMGIECLNNSGKARIYRDVRPDWQREKCQSCGDCARYCQWQALAFSGGVLTYDRNRCAGCGHCLLTCTSGARILAGDQIAVFQRRVAEAPGALIKTLNKKIIYLNFLIDVVPQPYRFAWADAPFVPDIGFLASLDPVAIDALSVDLVKWAAGIPGSAAAAAGVLAKGVEKFKAITGADPYVLLEHAERLGLGSRDYQVLIAGR